MTTRHGLDVDRIHALMMAALDDECSEAERRDLDALIQARPELSEEWSRLRRLKEVTMTMELKRPPEEVWDTYRTSVLHRAERSVAWLLIIGGAAVLVAGALWHALAGLLANWTEIPIEVRVGGTALAVGVIILVVSILRERWSLHRRDPYSREIIR